MRLLGLAAAILLAGCTTTPSQTVAPSASGPTSQSTATPVAITPLPSPPFAVVCGPLDTARCESGLAAVQARVAVMRESAPDLAPVAEMRFEPPGSLLTCPTSGLVCSVTGVVTFAKPGPLAIGLVLAGGAWTWQGPADGWWGADGTSYCVLPAHYRVNGRVDGIGPCVATLFDPSMVTISLAVGQTLDLHMSVTNRLVAQSRPWYPLPYSTSPTVVNIEAASDAADATYIALAVGTATLMTFGGCQQSAKTPNGLGQEWTGPCPVANIRVTAST